MQDRARLSSALHIVLTALLWLSMGLWPVRAEADALDVGAHAGRSDEHAPDVGNTSEPPEPIELEDEDDDIPAATVTRAPLAIDAPHLRTTSRLGFAAWAREICMTGAGSIRGPPSACPFGLVPKTR